MSWPACPRCKARDLVHNGPAFDATADTLRLVRGHHCRACGMKFWTAETVFATDVPTIVVRSKFGGFVRDVALAPYLDLKPEEKTLEQLLFD